MPKRATVRFQPLQTCLINLPLSIYGQLVTRQVTPQSLVVCLSFRKQQNGAQSTSSTSKEPQRAYVGWSGMPSRLVGGVAGIGKGEEAIEMDPVCARELGIPEGAEVAIDLLRNLPAARTVNVEPVNADDWEIVELHAEYVEQNLLSQVRAASPDQTLCVWVGKSRTLVRFRVENVEPSDDIAVRLTIDTEVVVAPKSRNPASALAKEKHNISSSSTPSQTTNLPLAVQRAKRQLLRVLPGNVNIPELSRLLEKPQEEATAWIHPRHFYLLSQAYPSTKVSLKIKPCPGQTQKSRQDDAQSEDAEMSDKGKGKGREANQEDDEQNTTVQNQTVDVHLRPSLAVPEYCIWLDGVSRRVLVTDEELFPLVKLDKPIGATIEQTTNDDAAVPELSMKPPSTPLAGMEKHLTKSMKHIRNTLISSRGLSSIPSTQQQTSGLLVCGASGCGKSSLVERIASGVSSDTPILAHSQIISCAPLVKLRVPQLQSRLNDIFTLAAWHAPSVVIFDDLDRLTPAEMEHIDSFRSTHIANLFLNIANKATKERGIVVVATVKGPETLHASLSQSHFFGERVNLSAPDKNARKQIIEMLLKAKMEGSEHLTIDPDLNYTAVSTQTEGYLPVDLKDLVDRCIHQCAIRAGKEGASNLVLSMKDVNSAQADFTPLSLRDIKLQKSEVQWSDIGGLQETRRVLRETLEWPTKYSAIFASSPLRLRSGLLLYGFPGCGKTLLASAVAKECGLNFISVKGPEILNKYIGASEKSVRDLFERAQAARPCVLFFDEFDSIAPKRGHDSTGVTDRVVNQMLTQMDGAEGLEGVYVLAATSRPDLIDPALLRPGRLDKSLLCDMPSSQDRLEIMQACSRKIALSDEIDLSDYVEETAGYSGADLQAVIYNAHLECIHNTISASKQEGSSDGVNGSNGQEEKEIEYISYGGKKQMNGQSVVSRAEKAKMAKRLEQIMQSLAPDQTISTKAVVSERRKTLVEPHHITSALRSTRPSVPRDEIMRLQRIYNEFVSARAKGGLPSGEASDEVGARSSLM